MVDPQRSNEQGQLDHIEDGEFAEHVAKKEMRKLRKRAEKDTGVWSELGMFGLVGWAVTVPTLLGVLIGMWLDKQVPGPFSWTLALLLAGIVLGCLNAWHWVSKEQKRIGKED